MPSPKAAGHTESSHRGHHVRVSLAEGPEAQERPAPKSTLGGHFWMPAQLTFSLSPPGQWVPSLALQEAALLASKPQTRHPKETPGPRGEVRGRPGQAEGEASRAGTYVSAERR